MPILLSLGFWQLERATFKQQLQATYDARHQAEPLSFAELLVQDDMAFISVSLRGRFDNSYSFLLDNRTSQGRAGYEVITPFVLEGPDAGSELDDSATRVVLVNRGWLPMGSNRQQLPAVPEVTGLQQINAAVDIPLKQGFVLMDEQSTGDWPRVIQRFDVALMAEQLDRPVFPHMLRLSKDSAGGLQIIWKPIIMRPEKHTAYAVQWFALAVTLTGLFLFATLKRVKETRSE